MPVPPFGRHPADEQPPETHGKRPFAFSKGKKKRKKFSKSAPIQKSLRAGTR